jgi:hypothetical protein
LERDESLQSSYQVLLYKIGTLDRYEVKEMNERMELLIDKIFALKREKKDREAEALTEKVLNNPDTWFKLIASADGRRHNFKPNFFSEQLRKCGYSKDEIKWATSLIHMPVNLLKYEELAFLNKLRATIPSPEYGIKILHANEAKNYFTTTGLNEKKGVGISGVWVDGKVLDQQKTS